MSVAHIHSHRRVLFAALAMLMAWEAVAWIAAAFLIKQTELTRADAILVLSGSANSLERAQLAGQLFAEGRALGVVLTNDGVPGGWSAEQQRNPLFVELAKEQLRRAGVPNENIEVLPRLVDSTYDEAVRAREFAIAHNLHSLLVVTSAYHSRRALWTFRRVFRDSNVAVALRAAPPGNQSPPAATWWLSVGGWRLVAGEYLKLIYYWLHYR